MFNPVTFIQIHLQPIIGRLNFYLNRWFNITPIMINEQFMDLCMRALARFRNSLAKTRKRSSKPDSESYSGPDPDFGSGYKRGRDDSFDHDGNSTNKRIKF